MALGHFCLAIEYDIAFYFALGLIVVGNGFFKPNISTFVAALYQDNDTRKDSGLVIFTWELTSEDLLHIIMWMVRGFLWMALWVWSCRNWDAYWSSFFLAGNKIWGVRTRRFAPFSRAIR